MADVRKTEDVWVVQQYTGPQYGWEDVAAGTLEEAEADCDSYRENDPQHPVRIIKRRVKKEQSNGA